ncbi:MAG: hypothetical protein JRJ20_05145 [Deltaproteobacteria bacterium]|nr:hypothetical protein [Deltaproteobacteria bacterium]
MTVWETTLSGKKRFQFGKDNCLVAVGVALQCSSFTCDDDDETVCDDKRSCYNCRYRRWTSDSFECMKL